MKVLSMPHGSKNGLVEPLYSSVPKSLTQFPDLNAKNTLSASIDNEAFKIASNQLLKNLILL